MLIASSLFRLRFPGAWADDKRHGHGTFTCEADGYRYEGSWVNGRKHGEGVLHLATGDLLSGLWENGAPKGQMSWQFNRDSPWSNPDF